MSEESVEIREEVLEQSEPSELDLILAKINAAFDWSWTIDDMKTTEDGLRAHYHYIKQNYHESQWPFVLAKSPQYAKYRLAERFNLVAVPIEEMDKYGTVKAQHLEVLGL